MANALEKVRQTLAALPMVAQGLAGASGVRVVFNPHIRTAQTDGKTIALPPLPLPASPEDSDAAEALADLVFGFIPHEVGHVIGSDFGVLKTMAEKSKLHASLLNAIEDPRQEASLIEKYPGTRLHLDRMLSRLIGKEGFYLPLKNGDHPTWLIAAYTMYLLRESIREQPAFGNLADQSRPALVDAFGEAFVSRLEVLVDVKGPKMRSSTDAARLAEDIIRAVKEAAQEKQAEADSTADSQPGDSGAGDADDSADSQSGDSGAGDADDSADSQPGDSGAGDADDSADSQSGDSGASKIADALERASSDADQPTLDDLGDLLAQSIRGHIDSIVSNAACDDEVEYVMDASAAIKESSDRAWCSGAFDSEPAMRQSGRLRALLRNEMQSATLERVNETARGLVLNQRKLYRTSNGDRRLFVNLDEQRGLDTAVFLLCDVSGSMSLKGQSGKKRITLAAEALFATAVALNGLGGVSTAVGTFPRFAFVVGFGEQPKRFVDSFALTSFGSTPLAEGVLWASRSLLKRSEKRKVLIVATDGEPDHARSAKAQIEATENMGIEVMGLGLCSDAVARLFKRHSVISNIEDVAPAMLNMVKGTLRRQLAA